MVALSMNQGGGLRGSILGGAKEKANQNLLKVVRPKLLGGMPKGRVKIPSLSLISTCS